jgi:hypothetical protein
MHPSFKSICRRVLWLLPLALLLSFSQNVPLTWAQPNVYVFASPFKFKGTGTEIDDKGNFHSESQNIWGTVEFYLTDSGDGDLIPVATQDDNPFLTGKYYVRVYDSNDKLLIGIDKMAALKTDHQKKKPAIKGMGTGTYLQYEGNAVVAQGPVYMHINSGTVIKNHDGSIKQINMNTKFYGGVMDFVNHYNLLFSGNPNVPLKLAPGPIVPFVE